MIDRCFFIRYLSKMAVVLLFIALNALVNPLQSQQKPKLLFLVGEGFNTSEFWIPYFSMTGAGYDVYVASYTDTIIWAGANNRTMDYHQPVLMENINPDNYMALIIPGGYSPGNLEQYPLAVEIAGKFLERDLPVGAICHGPRLLAATGLLSGRVTTGLVRIKDELPQLWTSGAFGQYTDRAVVHDNNLITSRYPLDSNPFSIALLEQYAALGYIPRPKTNPKVLVIDAGFSRLHRWAFFESGLRNNGIEVEMIRANDFRPENHATAEFVIVAGENVTPPVVNAVESHWKENHAVVSATDHQTIRKALIEIVNTTHTLTTRVKQPEEYETDAVIVIRSQFDEEVFIQARNYLEGMGVNFTIASDQTGWITGMNGHKALSEISFHELKDLPSQTGIILTGGFWTHQAYHEEDEQSAAYILWALDQWKKGATLLAFGTDSWRLVHREEFAEMPVATSEMYRWSFRNTARFSENGIEKTTDRIITARSAPYFFRAIQYMQLPSSSQ